VIHDSDAAAAATPSRTLILNLNHLFRRHGPGPCAVERRDVAALSAYTMMPAERPTCVFCCVSCCAAGARV